VLVITSGDRRVDQKKVEVFYVAPEAAKDEVWSYLAGKVQVQDAVRVLGSTPPPDALKAQWAATLGFDLGQALKDLWPDVSGGKGGKTVAAALGLQNVNANNLGAGRMRLVNQTIQALDAGMINPFSIPAQ